MPVYEYRCDSCNIQFELRQKFSDPPADRCPKCGGTVRKLVSAVSFSLKGSGWYGDGYGGTKAETTAENDTAAAATATASEGVTTDSAPTETSSETQASAPTQVETKSKAAEETPTKDKPEIKSKED